MAFNLGVGYVSIIPSFKGGSKAIEKGLNGQAAGKNVGGHFGSGFTSVMGKVAGLASAALTGAFVGKSLSKGLTRLMDVEDAKAKLTGLGHSAGAVTGIMQSALTAVKGTAFGMDEAATAAASAVAAGIKPGQELTKYLTLTGDAASIAGVSFNEMGAIMNKVTGMGKVQTQELYQISDRGIPIWKMLQDELGVTQVELQKMVSAGQVDAETFMRVMEQGVGGSAAAMGDTTRGAWKNMWASITRTAANLESGVFPLLKTGMQGITKALGPVEEKAKVVGTAFSDWATTTVIPKVKGVASEVQLGVGAMFTALRGGDTEGAQTTGIGGILLSIGQIGNDVWSKLGPVVKEMGPAVLDAAKAFSPLGIALKAAQPVLPDLVSGISDVAVALGGAVAGALPAFAGAVSDIALALGGALSQALPVVLPLLKGLLTTAIGLVTPILSNKTAVTVLVGALLAWKAVSLVSGLAGTTKALILNTAATVKDTAAKIASKAETAAIAAMMAKDFVVNLAKSTAELLRSGAAWTANTARIVAGKVAMVASTVATKAAAVATKLFNAAMRANPIGLVVTAIMLLVGAFVALYQKNETFRNIVNAVWSGIKSAISAVWNWISQYVIEPFKLGMQILGSAVSAAGQWISGAWTNIKNGISSAWNWINTYAFTPFRIGIDLLGRAGQVLGQGMSAAWNWIKSAISAAWTWINTYVISPFKLGLNLLKSAAQVMGQGITGAWNLVKTGISAAWNWINLYVFGPIKLGFQAVKNGATTLKDGVVGAFNIMKSGLQTAANWIKTNVIDKITGFFSTMQTKAIEVKNGIVRGFEAIPDGIRKAFEAVVGVVKKPLKSITDFIDKHLIGNVNKVTSKFGLTIPLINLKFNKGGTVPGGGPDRDSVLAAMTPGEGVINRTQTKRLGGPKAIAAINAGKFDPFASGGGGVWDWIGKTANSVKENLAKGAKFALSKVIKPIVGKFAEIVPGPPIVTDFLKGIFDQWGTKAESWGGTQDAAVAPESAAAYGPADTNGQYAFPLPRGSYSVGGGINSYPGHTGQDFPTPTGTPVFSPLNGYLTQASLGNRSYGTHSKVNAAGGILFIGAHLSSHVGPSRPIKAGELIGKSGSTGNSSGPHLHAEFRRGGAVVSPRQFLKYDSGGWVMPGTYPVNRTGRPEPVLTTWQWDLMRGIAATSQSLVNRMATGNAPGAPQSGGREVHMHFGPDTSENQVKALMEALGRTSNLGIL